MSPEIGRVAFRIAFFLVFVSAGLLFFTSPGSAEFVVSGVTLTIGVVFCVLVIVVARRQR